MTPFESLLHKLQPRHRLIGAVGLLLLLFLAWSDQAPAQQGKWLDYGSGMLNLAVVKSIGPSSRNHLTFGSPPGYLEFDGMRLVFQSPAEQDSALREIRSFLVCGDSYHRLQAELKGDTAP
ncbi:MAG TPA: hypothetical protein PK490_06910 [Prosthecobacter sp.]|nr:hypothetical protein [Prosthecobacter sp.]HRK14001.1 hypothetical protein [Prosthecobacter sp.]